MKGLLLPLILCWTCLNAQIQVLPDIDVLGESQIKLFLYKEALPYSQESVATDSIPAFFPMALPELKVPSQDSALLLKRNYLHLEANTRFGLDGIYRYYPSADWLAHAGMGLSLQRYEDDKSSDHYHLLADFELEEGEELGIDLFHFRSQAKDMESEYTLGSLTSYLDYLSIFGLALRDMSNSMQISGLEQHNGAFSYQNNGLAFTHHSLLELKEMNWGNRLYLYAGHPALHSFIEYHEEDIEKFGMHIFYDSDIFLAAPGFYWRKILDFDKQFSIANQPETRTNDFYELLEEYRWLSFDAAQRNTTIPLNLTLGLDKSFVEQSGICLAAYQLSNNTQYQINAPLLRDGINPQVPELYYSDVFQNQSRFLASFKRACFYFDQSLELAVAFLSEEHWVRKPYQALISLGSSLRYERYPFQAELSFEQNYFARDHYQKPLAEFLDLGFKAGYELNLNSQVYLKCANLLDSPNHQFKSLPQQDISFYAGIKHRF
ncbi:MAG: hypothetical protein PWP64_431 [Candidatus Cloacimonadota bacterium]|nr:hypothetical protein [Candidatus Cloacimonadota bacterium]